ncbi:MAG: ABC transporter ATP-binding protein [Turicibacter sp.]|nr:ABC transporter ATP-binding protein [Turicibacter sp.]
MRLEEKIITELEGMNLNGAKILDLVFEEELTRISFEITDMEIDFTATSEAEFKITALKHSGQLYTDKATLSNCKGWVEYLWTTIYPVLDQYQEEYAKESQTVALTATAKANQETVLEVRNLHKSYTLNKRQNRILNDVNFSVTKGEMVAIMGPSGSGKSTLLYAVSGMDEATSGTVMFNQRDISKMKPNEMADIRLNEMGFIFQQMYMLKNLTIFDNIILPAFQSKAVKKKSDRKEKEEYAKELMRKMGIIGVADNDINEVSGGQLQRACVCRSLVNQPKMIFADEPTGALNKQASAEVLKEIVNANREGTTVLMVTHDSKVASKSDRVIYIEDGGIKGDYYLGKYEGERRLKSREQTLNRWLQDMGW